MGIQFGWGLQLANMRDIYSQLGANPDEIPILWLVGWCSRLSVRCVIARGIAWDAGATTSYLGSGSRLKHWQSRHKNAKLTTRLFPEASWERF